MRCRTTLETVGVTVCLLFLLLMSASIQAQSPSDQENRSKASFLSNFPNFIEWPADAFPSAEAPFLVCVDGDISFGTTLAQMLQGKNIHDRHIEVRWVHKEADLRACHILFVSRLESKRYAKILLTVRGAGVLTVGETSDFLDVGGAVSFSFSRDSLLFEVNLGAANDARLKISSRLLAIAHRVVNKTAAASG
jgi:hypothetical protein